MNAYYPYLVVIIAAAVTIILRFLPFVIFHGRKTPNTVLYLGRVLPASIMGMLVVYCLRNTNITGGSHGLKELVSCAVVIALHKWRRNTLLSIIAGTAVYMLLVNLL